MFARFECTGENGVLGHLGRMDWQGLFLDSVASSSLLSLAEGDIMLYFAVNLALGCGLRRSEIAALKFLILILPKECYIFPELWFMGKV